MSDLGDNLARVRASIAEAALAAGRAPEEITLVGAAKTVEADRVAEVVELGLANIGENFVQEASAKIPAVRRMTTAPVTWHMIGHLQTNKAQAALDCFDIIESVDSSRLAASLSRRATSTQRILLEVYLGTDAKRPGFQGDELLESFAGLIALPHLAVQGLMTVAPLEMSPDQTAAVFRTVRELRDQLRERHPDQQLDILSMGMSDDFPLAIREGATAVRIGRAIFGARPS